MLMETSGRINKMKPINSVITGTLFVSALILLAASASAEQHDTDADQKDTTIEHDSATDDQNKSGNQQARTDEQQTKGADMSMEATFITSMEMDALLGNELMGKDVHSTIEDDKSIGTIDDLLINKEGEITAVIVSVGGFLGMGQKNVAIAWDSLDLIPEGDEYIITVNASQDALKNAPELEVE